MTLEQLRDAYREWRGIYSTAVIASSAERRAEERELQRQIRALETRATLERITQASTPKGA